MTTPEFYTPQEIATRLRLELRTVYDMLAPGGSLNHLRVQTSRRTVRIRAEGFEEFLAGGGVEYANS